MPNFSYSEQALSLIGEKNPYLIVYWFLSTMFIAFAPIGMPKLVAEAIILYAGRTMRAETYSRLPPSADIPTTTAEAL